MQHSPVCEQRWACRLGALPPHINRSLTRSPWTHPPGRARAGQRKPPVVSRFISSEDFRLFCSCNATCVRADRLTLAWLLGVSCERVPRVPLAAPFAEHVPPAVILRLDDLRVLLAHMPPAQPSLPAALSRSPLMRRSPPLLRSQSLSRTSTRRWPSRCARVCSERKGSGCIDSYPPLLYHCL